MDLSLLVHAAFHPSATSQKITTTKTRRCDHAKNNTHKQKAVKNLHSNSKKKVGCSMARSTRSPHTKQKQHTTQHFQVSQESQQGWLSCAIHAPLFCLFRMLCSTLRRSDDQNNNTQNQNPDPNKQNPLKMGKSFHRTLNSHQVGCPVPLHAPLFCLFRMLCSTLRRSDDQNNNLTHRTRTRTNRHRCHFQQ